MFQWVALRLDVLCASETYHPTLSRRPGPREEAVREVGVHREGLPDSLLLHHDKAQAVHHAVLLVGMALEVPESGALVLGCRPVDARERAGVERAPYLYGESVGSLWLTASLVADESDRFRHDVVGGEDLVRHPLAPEALHHIAHSLVVGIVPGEERKEEAGVEEDHL